MIYTDDQIEELISKLKVFDGNVPKMKNDNGSNRLSIEIKIDQNETFYVKLRQNTVADNPNASQDFSAILAYEDKRNKDGGVILRRYNGSSHKHQNKIEGNVIEYVTHRHEATERYQLLHDKIDGYAVTDDRFTDLTGAYQLLKKECNILIMEDLNDPQLKLEF